jgi:uncharacterized membrane protein required for colicin V production
MDYSLVIFAFFVLYSGYRGYKRGAMRLISNFVSLLAAYIGAYLFAEPFSELLAGFLPIQGLLAKVVGGVALFILISTLVSALFSALINKTKKNNEGKIGIIQSTTGGLLGAVMGVFIGFFFTWFFITLQTIYLTKTRATIAPETKFQSLAKRVISSGVKKAIIGTTNQTDLANATVEILSNPAENISRFKRLSDSGVIRKFFSDNSTRMALNSRNAKRVMQQTSFQQLMLQTDLVSFLQQIGLSKDSAEFQKQAAIKITTLWNQINQVSDNPEFIRLTNDPQIRKMIQQGNFVSMLNDEKIAKLLNIIISAKIPEITFTDVTKTKQSSTLPKEQDKIYRWTDKEGRIHYSDKKKQD